VNFGERIELELKKRGMKRKVFADLVGIPVGSIAIWKFRGSNPRAEVVARIARVLRTSSEELLNSGAGNSPEDLSDTILEKSDSVEIDYEEAMRIGGQYLTNTITRSLEMVEKLDSMVDENFWLKMKTWLIENRVLINGLTRLSETHLFEIEALVEAKLKYALHTPPGLRLSIPAVLDDDTERSNEDE